MKNKRFRVLNADEPWIIGVYSTTKEAYDVMKTLNHGLASYIIDDVVDQIEVPAYEFMKAFEKGENPLDLQTF